MQKTFYKEAGAIISRVLAYLVAGFVCIVGPGSLAQGTAGTGLFFYQPHICAGGEGCNAVIKATYEPAPTAPLTITAYVNGNEAIYQLPIYQGPGLLYRTASSETEDDLVGVNVSVSVSFTVTSTDPIWDGVSSTYRFNVPDTSVAGLKHSGAATLPSVEGSTGTFGVRLSKGPPTKVAIAVSASGDADIVEVYGAISTTVATTTLTFTPNNWDVTQTVMVSAHDNDLVEELPPSGYSHNIHNDFASGFYTITATVVASRSHSSYRGVGDTVEGKFIPDFKDRAGLVYKIAGVGGLSATKTIPTIREGEQTEVAIRLTGQPQSQVLIHPLLSTGSGLTLNIDALTFTAGDNSNWNIFQTITITSPDDKIDEDSATYRLSLRWNRSIRNNFYFRSLEQIVLTGQINDDDTASLVVSPANLGEVLEGDTTSFTIKLNSEPTAAVTVNFDDVTGGTAPIINPANVTFASDEWNVAQTVSVTVRAQNDDANGDVMLTISPAATSADRKYNDITTTMMLMIPLVVTDDEEAGYEFSIPAFSTLPNIIEGGSPTTFNVRLQGRPLTPVTVTVASTEAGAAAVSPALLSYTSTNWEQDQTVTITPRAANLIDEADVSYIIAMRYHAGDTVYDLDTIYSWRGIVKDNAGFELEPLGLDVVEGESSTFTAKLDKEPTTPVTLTVFSSSAQINLAPAKLTFTSTDWQALQTSTITASDNDRLSNLNYVVTVSVVTGSDPVFSGLSELSGTIIDDDRPIVLGPASLDPFEPLPELEEGGSPTTFTVKLGARPQNRVVLTVTSTNPAVASASPEMLTFEPGQWSSSQVVSVMPRPDNSIVDFDYEYWIEVDVMDGSDAAFINYESSARFYYGNVMDNDSPSLIVTPAGAGPDLETVAEGATTTFDVRLGTKPPIDVTLTFTNTEQVSLSTTKLTFTPSDWATAQEVTVTGLDDLRLDGEQSYMITLSVYGASDSAYKALPAETLSGLVTDSNAVGFTLDPPSTLPDIIEGAGRDRGKTFFTVVLDIVPQNDVILTISSSNEEVATVDRSTLTFTATNSTVPQPVFVSPNDDDIEADTKYKIIVAVVDASSDDVFNAFSDITLDGTVLNNVDSLFEAPTRGRGARLSPESKEQAEAAIARADTYGAAQVAMNLISERLLQAPTLQPKMQLAGTDLLTQQSTPPPQFFSDVEDLDSWNNVDEEWSDDLNALLTGTAFVLPLSATHGDGMGGYEVWGAFGHSNLQGDSFIDRDTIDYDGKANGVHIGFGQRYIKGTGWGVSVSSTNVKMDLEGDHFSNVERDLVSVHPYFGWSPWAGADAWVVTGYGDGDYELEYANSDVVEKTKASMQMVGGGLQHSWVVSDFDLAVRLEGIVTKSELDDTDVAIKDAEGSAWQTRFEFEIGKNYTTEGGVQMKPYGTLGYRQDGGDLDGIEAVELGLGLKSQIDAAWSTSMDLLSHAEVSGSENKRHSLRSNLKYDADSDRRGLFFSLSNRLEYEETDETDEESDITRVLEGRVGYGWSQTLLQQRGTLNVHLHASSEDDGLSGSALGLKFISPSLQMDVEGDRDEVSAHFNYVITSY